MIPFTSKLVQKYATHLSDVVLMQKQIIEIFSLKAEIDKSNRRKQIMDENTFDAFCQGLEDNAHNNVRTKLTKL